VFKFGRASGVNGQAILDGVGVKEALDRAFTQ